MDKSLLFEAKKIFDEVEIAADGTAEVVIPMELLRGYFSIHFAATGDGVYKAEYLLSNNKTSYLAPSNGDISNEISSGMDSSSEYFHQIEPLPAASMKIKLTETGGASSVTVSAWLIAI